MVVGHAVVGVLSIHKISNWISSSKSLVDKRRFWQNGQALQLMDLHWRSCGIHPYLPNLWLIVRRMIVVEHAGIKISYWVSSSKSLVDKRRFRQNGPVSQHVRKEPTKNKFLVNFCFELTAQHLFSSDLPLPPKYLVDKRRMIVVEHVEICCCTCIEQIVAFAFLVVEFPFVGLAVAGLASNKLWELPLPPKSLVESKKNASCGTCRDQNLLLSFII